MMWRPEAWERISPLILGHLVHQNWNTTTTLVYKLLLSIENILQCIPMVLDCMSIRIPITYSFFNFFLTFKF
jgi:hypothetical protein